MTPALSRMHPKIVMQNERRQTQETTCCIVSFVRRAQNRQRIQWSLPEAGGGGEH